MVSQTRSERKQRSITLSYTIVVPSRFKRIYFTIIIIGACLHVIYLYHFSVDIFYMSEDNTRDLPNFTQTK